MPDECWPWILPGLVQLKSNHSSKASSSAVYAPLPRCGKRSSAKEPDNNRVLHQQPVPSTPPHASARLRTPPHAFARLRMQASAQLRTPPHAFAFKTVHVYARLHMTCDDCLRMPCDAHLRKNLHSSLRLHAEHPRTPRMYIFAQPRILDVPLHARLRTPLHCTQRPRTHLLFCAHLCTTPHARQLARLRSPQHACRLCMQAFACRHMHAFAHLRKHASARLRMKTYARLSKPPHASGSGPKPRFRVQPE